jgi:uncharacterized protein YdhG (YjbR/CyaY superfamily)
VKSEAPTVDLYLESLPEDRRRQIEEVRNVILDNLPQGFEEAMNWGMISYQVPLERYPDTYNGQPLMYAALASQKNHMAVYLTSVYTDEGSRAEFEAAYRATGKKMDVGKSCVRFKKLEDLPLELVGETIARTSVAEFIDTFERARA